MGLSHDTSARQHDGQPPLVLLVPGLGNSGPAHWQSLWERDDENCRRVELGLWDRPHRNTWVNHLNLAIRAAGRPVLLAAHSLGCHAVAWWAKLEQPGPDSAVIGALLVAPPEVDFFPRDERIDSFAPTPPETLPFPSMLVASRNDPWMSFLHARRLARSWGSELIDAGDTGHINADSDLGHWPEGRRLLARLADRQAEPIRGTDIRTRAGDGRSEGDAASG